MKYKGIYWTLFAPKIKRSIKKRYSMELAQRAIKNGMGEYRRLLDKAEGLVLIKKFHLRVWRML